MENFIAKCIPIKIASPCLILFVYPHPQLFYITQLESLNLEKGVCQDYAHILMSLSKIFNIPSRYVNGYLMDDNNISNYSSCLGRNIY